MSQTRFLRLGTVAAAQMLRLCFHRTDCWASKLAYVTAVFLRSGTTKAARRAVVNPDFYC